MNVIDRARLLRATIENLAVVLPDETAVDNVELFPLWSGNGVFYKTGDRVRYQGYLYRVLQNHTSQGGWTPESAPSLFARVLIPDPEKIYPWIQPDSTNGYSINDKVYYPNEGDTIYISLVDNNVWVPTTQGVWAVYNDGSDEDEPIPTPDPEPDEDEDEIHEWSQPDGIHPPYMTGDKVTHNGKIWESLIDNNVWEPLESLPTLWKEITE